MNNFDVNEVARKLLSLLKDKFPDANWDTCAAGSPRETLNDVLFFSEDLVTSNVMLNWLLSLDDEDVPTYCQLQCCNFDDHFTGAAKEMFDRLIENE